MKNFLVTVAFVIGGIEVFNVESMRFDGDVLVLYCTDGNVVEIRQAGTMANQWNEMTSFLVTM